jgi:C-terminal processing protease CtpA/Prc
MAIVGSHVTIFVVAAIGCGRAGHDIADGPPADAAATAMFAPDVDILQDRLDHVWANRPIHEAVDHVDVPGILQALRQRSTGVSSIQNFAPLLRDAIAQLDDGHLRLASATPKIAFDSGLSFQLTDVGVALFSVTQDRYGDLPEGSLLVQVDDLAVSDYLQVKRNRGGSTPVMRQNIAIQLLNRQTLFADETPTPRRLMVTTPGGVSRAVDVQWRAEAQPQVAPCVEGEMIRPTIGLLRVHTFSCLGPGGDASEFVRQLGAAVQTIASAPQIVIDVRDNPGGYENESAWVLGLFVSGKIEWSRLRSLWPNVDPGPHPNLVDLTSYSLPTRLQGARVSVLIGPGCFSQCDIFMHNVRNYTPAMLFGQPTGGGAGGPVPFTLSTSGFTVDIPVLEVYVSGSSTELVETNSVTPDVTILPRVMPGQPDTVLDDVLDRLTMPAERHDLVPGTGNEPRQ